MKKLLLVTAIVLVSGVAFAADNANVTTSGEHVGSSPDRFVRRIMPQAQVIYSNYSTNGGANTYNNRQGWGAGALFDLGSWNHLVLETGAMYRELNAQSQDTFGTTDLTNRYISIPVSAKWYLSGQEQTSLYLKAGAMASTLVSNTATTSPGYAGAPQTWNGRTWETSWLGGAGLKFPITPASDLFVEADYTRATDTAFTNANVINAAWNFGAGFGLNL